MHFCSDAQIPKGIEGRVRPNGGVKVVELGTDRRLSLAQNPVVRGNEARHQAA